MSEESERMMVLLQELAALKSSKRSGARGERISPAERGRQRQKIVREIQSIAKQAKKNRALKGLGRIRMLRSSSLANWRRIDLGNRHSPTMQ